MAKLAINILIEKRKKLDKDSPLYSTVSLLLHLFLIALLVFTAGYSRYRESQKPKVYKVAIAALPVMASKTKGENGGRKVKADIATEKPEPKQTKTNKKVEKKKKAEGISVNKKSKKEKKAVKKRAAKKAENNSDKGQTLSFPKKGFSSPASSVMDLDSVSFNYSYYLAIVRNKIGENWVRTYTGTGKVKVYFKIMKSGEIRDAKVEISSGNPGLDRLALEAVLKSNPLPPLPEEFRESFIGIHIWFNYEE